MKTIVATMLILFAFTMPVHAEWKPYSFDEMNDNAYKSVQYIYNEDNLNEDTFFLIFDVSCKLFPSWFPISGINFAVGDYSLNGISLSEEYETLEGGTIRVRFDKEPAFTVKGIVPSFHSDKNHIQIKDIDAYEFLNKMKKHRRLLVRVYAYNPDKSYRYLTARINLIGFTKTYNSHCG